MSILNSIITIGKNSYSYQEDLSTSFKTYSSKEQLQHEVSLHREYLDAKRFVVLNVVVLFREDLDSPLEVISNDTWKNPLKVLDIINRRAND